MWKTNNPGCFRDTIGDRSKETANKPPGNKADKKANFAAMVNYMDQIVGRIVDKVEATGQLENTIILFTADNGTLLPGPLLRK